MNASKRPWRAKDYHNGEGVVLSADGVCVHCRTMNIDDAELIVRCVNACEGLRAEKIREAISAAEQFMACVCDYDIIYPDDEGVRVLNSALAAVKGDNNVKD